MQGQRKLVRAQAQWNKRRTRNSFRGWMGTAHPPVWPDSPPRIFSRTFRMTSNYIASGRIVAPAGSQTAWESSNAAWIFQAQTWIQEGQYEFEIDPVCWYCSAH